MHPYSSIDTTAAWKKVRFILLVKSDFHLTDRLLLAVHVFASHVSMSVSDDETLLPSQVNVSTSFWELPLNVEMSPVWLKHIYPFLCLLTYKPIPAAAWFPVFISNANYYYIHLFKWYFVLRAIGIPLYLKVMAKGFYTDPCFRELEPQHQMLYCNIPWTLLFVL